MLIGPTRNTRRRLAAIAAALTLGLGAGSLAACGSDEIDQAGTDIENAAEDAGNEIEGAANEAGEEIEGAAEDAGNAADEAANDVEGAVSDDEK